MKPTALGAAVTALAGAVIAEATSGKPCPQVGLGYAVHEAIFNVSLQPPSALQPHVEQQKPTWNVGDRRRLHFQKHPLRRPSRRRTPLPALVARLNHQPHRRRWLRRVQVSPSLPRVGTQGRCRRGWYLDRRDAADHSE